MKLKSTLLLLLTGILALTGQAISQTTEPIRPLRSEVIKPIRNETFNKNGACPERKLGGNSRTINELPGF